MNFMQDPREKPSFEDGTTIHELSVQDLLKWYTEYTPAEIDLSQPSTDYRSPEYVVLDQVVGNATSVTLQHPDFSPDMKTAFAPDTYAREILASKSLEPIKLLLGHVVSASGIALNDHIEVLSSELRSNYPAVLAPSKSFRHLFNGGSGLTDSLDSYGRFFNEHVTKADEYLVDDTVEFIQSSPISPSILAVIRFAGNSLLRANLVPIHAETHNAIYDSSVTEFISRELQS